MTPGEIARANRKASDDYVNELDKTITACEVWLKRARETRAAVIGLRMDPTLLTVAFKLPDPADDDPE